MLRDPDRAGQRARRGRRPRRRGPTSTTSCPRSAIHASFVPKPACTRGIADRARDVRLVELQRRCARPRPARRRARFCSTWRGVSGWASTPSRQQRPAVDVDDRLEVRRLGRQLRGRALDEAVLVRPPRSSSLWRRSKPIVEETFMSMPGPAAQRAAEVARARPRRCRARRQQLRRAASGRCRARPPPCRPRGRAARCRRRTACRRSAPPTAPAPRAVSISANAVCSGRWPGRVQRAHAHGARAPAPSRRRTARGRSPGCASRWMWIVRAGRGRQPAVAGDVVGVVVRLEDVLDRHAHVARQRAGTRRSRASGRRPPRRRRPRRRPGTRHSRGRRG